VLLPKPLHAFTTDTKTSANFAGALTASSRIDNPLAQILTQRPHKSLFIEKQPLSTYIVCENDLAHPCSFVIKNSLFQAIFAGAHLPAIVVWD
jgi:hypothetical protein